MRLALQWAVSCACEFTVWSVISISTCIFSCLLLSIFSQWNLLTTDLQQSAAVDIFIVSFEFLQLPCKTWFWYVKPHHYPYFCRNAIFNCRFWLLSSSRYDSAPAINSYFQYISSDIAVCWQVGKHFYLNFKWKVFYQIYQSRLSEADGNQTYRSPQPWLKMHAQ